MKYAFQGQRHMVDFLFTLALFCVFAASSLLVVTIGANVYKNTVSSMDENYDLRSSLTYVSEKMRQNDAKGAVLLQPLEGEEALVLEQSYGAGVYQTWIYVSNGELKEVFTKKGNPFHPADGQTIGKLAGFEVSKAAQGLYRLRVTAQSGRTAELLISPRSAE